ncbi:MAG: hypothetical protein ABFS42_05830 [Candidatus Krumholzibacteriota bacterium]
MLNRRLRPTGMACLLVCWLWPGIIPAQTAVEATAGRPGSTNIFGAAASVNHPYESFGKENSTGYGLHAIMDYPFIPLLDFTADIGWNHFPGANGGAGVDVWEFAGGMRFVMGVFFMSGEVGYYTEVDDTSFLPGMGLRFDRLEFSLRVKAVTGGSWTGFRFGYYF